MGKVLSTHVIPGFYRRRSKDVRSNDLFSDPSQSITQCALTKATIVFPPNEDCPICLCECDEELTSLECGHILHTDCLKQQIASWSAEEKLSWIAISCPLCRQILETVDLVHEALKEIKILKQKTDFMALEALKENVREIIPGSHPSRKLKRMTPAEQLELSYRKLAFYLCGKCMRPYCGGTISCFDAANDTFSSPNAPEAEVVEDNNHIADHPESNEVDDSGEPSLDVDKQLLENSNNDSNVCVGESKKEEPSTGSETDDDYDVSSDEEVSVFGTKDERVLLELLNGEPGSDDLELQQLEPESEIEPEPQVEVPPPLQEIVEAQPFKYMCLECLTNKPCGHPTNQLIYKCIKCCSIATFYCLGTEFYCERCHNDLKTVFVCPGKKKCPLGISHPPNTVGTHGGGNAVTPFVVGCRICGDVSYSMDDIHQKADQFVIDYY